MTIEELYKIIVKRQKNMPSNSYVASLLRSGSDRIIQKFGEEAVEVIVAAKDGKRKKIISEFADLWFNSLILMVEFKIKIKDILNELDRRNK